MLLTQELSASSPLLAPGAIAVEDDIGPDDLAKQMTHTLSNTMRREHARQ